jgi:hypothetical protein
MQATGLSFDIDHPSKLAEDNESTAVMLAAKYGHARARCSVLNLILYSRMPLVPTPARLKHLLV